MFKIMLIEDDKKLCSLIKHTFEKYGYRVVIINHFNEIEQEFDKENPDLILLDITLPYYDGFYYCRLFRRKSNIPIIITSSRSGNMDQIMGMELGADDYIVKPFDLEVLSAKVRSSLRRSYGEYSAVEDKNINVEGISLDDKSFKVYYKNNVMELSKNEFKLMKKFLTCKDVVISREDLLLELWDDSDFVDDNTLTVNVTRVKSKLSEMGIDNAIKTKRGIGYIFDSSTIGEKHD